MTNAKTTTITDTQLANWCEEQTTVEVTAADENGHEETFAVQTVDSIHRSDLGCWITTTDSDGDIDADDYQSFDIEAVISAAEYYIQSITDEKRTEYKDENGESIVLIVTDNTTKIVVENSQFINADASSYQREYSEPLASFDTEQEALEYCADNF